ncbi:MAG: hypothetical protein CUN53_00065, partial [Phototrophicales bacterium]
MIEPHEVLDQAARVLALIPRAPGRRDGSAIAECAMILADACENSADADELASYLAHHLPEWPRGSWGELRRVALAWRRHRQTAAAAAARTAPPPATPPAVTTAHPAPAAPDPDTPQPNESFADFDYRRLVRLAASYPAEPWPQIVQRATDQLTAEFRALPESTRAAYLDLAKTRLADYIRQQSGRNLQQHRTLDQHPALSPENVEQIARHVWDQCRHGFI